MSNIKASVKGSKIVVEISAKYLKRAFKMGVTTNTHGTVTDEAEMLKHFAREFKKGDADSHIGRFIDGVCEEAIGDGELFVELDEDD